MLIRVGPYSPGERVESALEESNTREELNGIVDLLSHYQNLSRLKNKQGWAAINLHNRSLLTEPVSLLCGASIRNDIFSFCHALIHVAARWKEIAPATTPCPIQFTDHEVDLHNGELKLVEGRGEVLY